jgi:hypothetical protein
MSKNFAVVAVMALALSSCAGQNSEIKDRVQNLKDDYYRCVRNSAASQMVAQARQIRDGNAIAETAFQACATEESNMRVFVASLDASPLEATAIVNKHKSILKREIVEANPSPIAQRANPSPK